MYGNKSFLHKNIQAKMSCKHTNETRIRNKSMQKWVKFFFIKHSLLNFIEGAQSSCHLQQQKPYNGESLIGKRVQTIQGFHRQVLLLPQLKL